MTEEFARCAVCAEKSHQLAFYTRAEPDGLQVRCKTCGISGPVKSDQEVARQAWNGMNGLLALGMVASDAMKKG